MTNLRGKKSSMSRGAPLPVNVETEKRMCVCLCIPDEPEYRRAFVAQLHSLGKWWHWEKGGLGDTRAKKAAELWRRVLWEDLKMPCGGNSEFPVQERLTPTGDIERSTDGGETWVVLPPNKDPRHAGSILPAVPPSPGVDSDCRGANSVIAMLQDLQADQYARMQQGATAANLIAAFVAFIVGIGIIVTGGVLAVLATALGAFLASLSADEFNNSFSPQFWKDLLCIIKNNAEDDGSVTVDQWKTVVSETKALGGTPGRWAGSVLESMGVTGLTNASRTNLGGSIPCDDCEQTGCFSPSKVTLGYGTTYVGEFNGRHRFMSGFNASANCFMLEINWNDGLCCKYVTNQHVSGNQMSNRYQVNCGLPVTGGNIISDWILGSNVRYLSAQRPTNSGSDPANQFVIDIEFAEPT